MCDQEGLCEPRARLGIHSPPHPSGQDLTPTPPKRQAPSPPRQGLTRLPHPLLPSPCLRGVPSAPRESALIWLEIHHQELLQRSLSHHIPDGHRPRTPRNLT